MCASAEAVQTWPAPDWAQPWNAPFALDGAAVRAACEAGVPLPQALTQRIGTAGPRFVSQAELPDGMAYEQFIFDTGSVPTREGLHDFFNGLVWKRFPATKRLLNRLQAAEIRRQASVGAVRCATRSRCSTNARLLQALMNLGR
jgi:hypothetical protein